MRFGISLATVFFSILSPPQILLPVGAHGWWTLRYRSHYVSDACVSVTHKWLGCSDPWDDLLLVTFSYFYTIMKSNVFRVLSSILSIPERTQNSKRKEKHSGSNYNLIALLDTYGIRIGNLCQNSNTVIKSISKKTSKESRIACLHVWMKTFKWALQSVYTF